MSQDQPSPNPPPTVNTATATANTTPATTTRRVPPPCWTHEETVALIDSYHEKWYSLRRGNLKASHWQDVADAVARRCRLASPSKTSVQCRHKIEKLRKRYRTEKQRALLSSFPNHHNNRSFVSSSWVFFRQMEAMEKGLRPPSSDNAAAVDEDEDDDDDSNDEDQDDNDDEDQDDDDDEINPNNSRNLHDHLMSNGSGFRLRIPGGQRSVSSIGSGDKKQKSFFVRANGNPNPNNPSNPNCGSVSGSGARLALNGCSWARSGDGGGGRKREGDPLAEMVTSIRMLGEGFVRMEKMKIEMAREMEQMRMEMEMKRTEMILESQRRIVEAFAKGEFSGKKKKPKRMASSPDS